MAVTPYKDPSEILDISFNLTERVDDASVTSASVSVACDGDVDVSSFMLGEPTIIGAIVLQRVQCGTAGNTYFLRLQAGLSDGRILVEVAQIPVRFAL